jgi:hypothetical protein
MRMLDNAGIAYTFKEYEADDGDHLGVRAAASASFADLAGQGETF